MGPKLHYFAREQGAGLVGLVALAGSSAALLTLLSDATAPPGNLVRAVILGPALSARTVAALLVFLSEPLFGDRKSGQYSHCARLKISRRFVVVRWHQYDPPSTQRGRAEAADPLRRRVGGLSRATVDGRTRWRRRSAELGIVGAIRCSSTTPGVVTFTVRVGCCTTSDAGRGPARTHVDDMTLVLSARVTPTATRA